MVGLDAPRGGPPACLKVFDYNETTGQAALASVQPDLILDCVGGPQVRR